MNEPIHIHVTCRRPEMLPAATLVFRTLRVGFPEAEVHVYFPEDNDCGEEIESIAVASGAEFRRSETFGHDMWLRDLIVQQEEPFWICDTDVVFWRRFEHSSDGSALAGVRVPSFFEPWTGTHYRERLHTCLMRIDPIQFGECELWYRDGFPQEPFQPQLESVLQQWIPERRNSTVITHFYDTLAMAWHAFGGQEFTQAQIESFDHLNCATYADLIAPALDFDIVGAHKAIYENIELARGSWAKQFEWFAAHQEKHQ